jgi:hypothetical protein
MPVWIQERFDAALDEAGLYEYVPPFKTLKGVPYDDPMCLDFIQDVPSLLADGAVDVDSVVDLELQD